MKNYARQYAIAASGIAQHYAAAGDAWNALHAQVLSYTATAELVMRLHSLEPRDTILKIADGIEKLDTSAASDSPEKLLSDVLKVFAYELPALCVADFFSVIMSPRDLDITTPIDDRLHEQVIARWLDGKTPQQFIRNRRELQVKYLTQAKAMIEAGDIENAILAIHNSDVAAFETWVIEHALDTGETGFTLARIQWDFFIETIANLSYLPAEMSESINTVRSRMAWVLGPQNAKNFADVIPEI